MTLKVAVVGGGLSGLAAAYRLTQLVDDLDLTVYEASDRVGGNIKTSPFAGASVDEAADAFLMRHPEAVALCDELGLGDDLVHPSGLPAGIWVDGQICDIPAPHHLGVPASLESLAASPLVGPVAVDALRLDLAGQSPRLDSYDDCLGLLLRTRLGDEITDNIVEPLLHGVYASPVDQLSLAAVTPQFAEVADEPSFVSALGEAAARRNGGSAQPMFGAPRGGMGRLIEALAQRLGETVVTSAVVSSVVPGEGHPTVSVDGSEQQFDAVVVATPGQVTKRLLAHKAAEVFRADPVSVAFVTLAFDPTDVGISLHRSGFLVPTTQDRNVTACSFTTSKWLHLQTDKVIVRAAVGRADDDAEAQASQDEIVEAVLADLAEMLELSGRPTGVRVSAWPNSFPKYLPGHIDRIAEAQESLEGTGIFVAGASVTGIGIPACIRSGEAAARQIAASQ